MICRFCESPADVYFKEVRFVKGARANAGNKCLTFCTPCYDDMTAYFFLKEEEKKEGEKQ